MSPSTSGASSKPGARWDTQTVAVHLGFTDPANLGRFFRDRIPAAFAAREATTDP